MNKIMITHKAWFKVMLACVMFFPLVTAGKYNPINTFSIIAEVLKKPFSVQVIWLLPIAKIIFLAVVVTAFFICSRKMVLGYYALALAFTGVFQNMAYTDYGFTFITGNAVLQYIAMAFCIYDLVKGKSKLNKKLIDKTKLWILPLMAFAYLMPYTLQDGVFRGGIGNVFSNVAGVTYCMITPCIIGILIIFHRSIYKPTLNILSFVGVLFGVCSMTTWLVFDSANWWLGVIRIPLLVISFYGLMLSRNAKGAS